MTVSFGKTVTFRSLVASLAIAMLLASGCKQDDEEPSSAPLNPVPRAGLPQPAAAQDGSGRGDEGGLAGREGLHKALAAPLIKPDTPTTKATPATKTNQP